MAISQIDLDRFADSMNALCREFNVFIKQKTIRKESPTAPDFYYELQLSVKVGASSKGTPDFSLEKEVVEIIEGKNPS